MKRLVMLVTLLACAAVLFGCDNEGQLWPVQGPLASQPSPRSFPIRFTKIYAETGGFSTTLANGEVFKGTWIKLNSAPTKTRFSDTPKKTPDNGTPANTAGEKNGSGSSLTLASAWDTVYGSGFYTAHVLGQPLSFRGTAKGSRGTTFTIEEYKTATGSSQNPIYKMNGVAVDSNGNIYKFT